MNTKLIITATVSVAAFATGVVMLVKNRKEAKATVKELSDALAESSIEAIKIIADEHPHNEVVQAQAKKSIEVISASL